MEACCAICAGPTAQPYWEWENEETQESDAQRASDEEPLEYDPSIIKPGDERLNWLKDVSLMCENPSVESIDKVYMTDEIEHFDYNIFDVQGGDDPNTPAVNDIEGTLQVYSWEASHPFAVPVHNDCLKLLLRFKRIEHIDKMSLYSVFKSLAHSEEYFSSLNIEYDTSKSSSEEAWSYDRGYEHLVFSPFHVPELEAYYAALPRSEAADQGNSMNVQVHSSDPFSKLAPETHMAILDRLDIFSVLNLRQASGSVFNLGLKPIFHRNRMMADMPWLFDFPTNDSIPTPELINWKQVYKDLYACSLQRAGEQRLHGLANRRRIWETPLSRIANEYSQFRHSKIVELASQPVPLMGAIVSASPHLTAPTVQRVTTNTHAFVQSYSHISTAKPLLLCAWNEKGHLVDLSVQQQDHNHVYTDNAAEFPAKDWLSALIVTSKEYQAEDQETETYRRIVGMEIVYSHSPSHKFGSQKGDRRILCVSEGLFAVGIATDIATDNYVAKISLLQQPYKSATGIKRITRRHNDQGINAGAEGFLWSQELPPSPLIAEQIQPGYFNSRLQLHVEPMDALVFGCTDEELNDITSFSADVFFGWFRVSYGSRPPRSIGSPCQAFKTLTIRGADGERIQSIHHSSRESILQLRFCTNWGRQLIVGHRVRDNELSLPPTDTELHSQLAGFYVLWQRSSSQIPWMSVTAIGGLYKPTQHVIESDPPTGLLDNGHADWEPQQPPPNIEELGKVLGQHERPVQSYEESVPNSASVASWLDCSRPVQEITVSFCHSPPQDELPLCSISFEYADDGEQVRIGPQISQSLQKGTNENTKDGEWCWCVMGMKNDKNHKELQEISHFTTQSQNIDGEFIKTLRVWLSDIGSLVALQFTTENHECPVWTREPGNLGPPTNEIAFVGPGSGEAMGIKFIFYSTGRSVTREDSIVVALQAMRKID